MRRLAVLGGSTPFTAGLVEALRRSELPAHALVLLGRSEEHLAALARHARHRLAPRGWTVRATTDARAGLEGADIVIHQVRYGDMAGRAADEALAVAVGVPPDETLGVAGLASVLRLRSGLAETCALLAAACPDAWVLNLTNPLSLVVAWMHDHGVRRCIGLCELPRVTAARAAAVLGGALDDWAYAGLNHRGFVTRLVLDGRDRLPELADRLGEGDLRGIGAPTIRALGALPTSYFRLLAGAPSPIRAGRAAVLDALKDRLLEELVADPRRPPPGLAARTMDWYPHAVVPALVALSSPIPIPIGANVFTARGIVEEGRVLLSQEGVGPLLPAPVPPAVAPWCARFVEHERRALEAVRRPSRATVRAALAADPLVPAHRVEEAAEGVWSAR